MNAHNNVLGVFCFISTRGSVILRYIVNALEAGAMLSTGIYERGWTRSRTELPKPEEDLKECA